MKDEELFEKLEKNAQRKDSPLELKKLLVVKKGEYLLCDIIDAIGPEKASRLVSDLSRDKSIGSLKEPMLEKLGTSAVRWAVPEAEYSLIPVAVAGSEIPSLYAAFAGQRADGGGRVVNLHHPAIVQVTLEDDVCVAGG